MHKKYNYDLIVIGSGPAGSSAALAASKSGLKTAIIESTKWGGAYLNTLDVPALASFEFSHLYHAAKQGARLGLSSSTLRYNFPTAQNWRQFATRRAGASYKKSLESANIACLSGFASFISPHEVAIKDKIISAPRFIIATGAKLSYGDISGIESVECLTPADAVALPRPPKSVFIVGAGSTGVELADYFAELGSEVVIGELSNRLLPREEVEASDIMTRYFENSLQIKVLTQSRVTAVQNSAKPGLKRVVFRRASQEKAIEVQAVVLATGSKPVISLSLENAGVEYSPDGIKVDKHMRTTAKHIFAAGDCLGGESSFERARYQGELAATNSVGKAKIQVNQKGFARITNTSPSVACIGMTENECAKLRVAYHKVIVPLSATLSSTVTGFQYGFAKLLTDPKSVIIGATVVSPEAELIAQELAIAVRLGLTANQLVDSPHVSSAWSEVIRLAAEKLSK